MDGLQYSLTNYVDIAKSLCKAINGELFENYYTASNQGGRALVEFFDYGDFSIMLSQYEVFKEVKISRSFSDLQDHIAFDFLLRGESETFLNKANEGVKQFQFGCYVTTPSTESMCVYRPSNKYDLLSVLIHKDWLTKFMGQALPSILQNPNEPLFIYVPINHQQVVSLKGLVRSEPHLMLRKPYLYSKSLEAITFIIESLYLSKNKFGQHSFPPSDLEIIYQLVEWLEDNLGANLTVEGLSLQFGMNRNRLQFMFKSIFGQTVGDYIRSLKMYKARELLLQNHSVAEVGYRMGFSNLSHFSKSFKKVHGINPSEV